MARSLRIALASVVAAAGVAGFPAAAAAHGDDGELTILSTSAGTDANGAAIVHVEVDLTYENDGEHAGAAIVTAILRGPDGSATPPAPVPHQSGQSKYAADLAVPVPGTWTVELTAVGPDATATTTVEVAPRPTTAPTTSPSTTAVPTSGVPTTVDAAPDDVDVARPEGDEDDGGRNVGAIAAAIIGAGAVAGTLAIRARRRNR